MFPYRDENQTQRTAIVTMLVIALNVAIVVYLVVRLRSERRTAAEN